MESTTSVLLSHTYFLEKHQEPFSCEKHLQIDDATVQEESDKFKSVVKYGHLSELLHVLFLMENIQ